MPLHKLIASVVALAGVTTFANASTVDMQFVGMGHGWQTAVTVNSITQSRIFTGERLHQFSNGTGMATRLEGQTIATYSTDLFQDVASSGAVFELASTADIHVNDENAHRSALIQNLLRYHANFDQSTLAHDSQRNDFATAFQLALWELVYEPQLSYDGALGTMSLTSGAMTVTRPDGGQIGWWVRNYFNQFAQASNNFHAGNVGLIALTNDQYMDQVTTVPVPLPSTAALAVAGLSFASTRRRR